MLENKIDGKKRWLCEFVKSLVEKLVEEVEIKWVVWEWEKKKMYGLLDEVMVCWEK